MLEREKVEALERIKYRQILDEKSDLVKEKHKNFYKDVENFQVKFLCK